MDYRDHKPHLNAPLLRALVSGVGLRQIGRILPLSHRCAELKARKIGRHLRAFNRNLRGRLVNPRVFQIGEVRTFEANRRACPVTLTFLIDATSRFHVWAQSETLRPGEVRVREKAIPDSRTQPRDDKRRDRSRRAVLAVARAARAIVAGAPQVAVASALKKSRARLLRQVFGQTRVLLHEESTVPSRGSGSAGQAAEAVTEGKDKSGLGATVSPWMGEEAVFRTLDPLSPLRLAKAMARDNLGRLRPHSWLASKQRRFLDLAFHAYMAWRNCVRPRFNGELRTPSEWIGFTSRPLTAEDLLGWRQDLGVHAIPVPGVLAHRGRRFGASSAHGNEALGALAGSGGRRRATG